MSDFSIGDLAIEDSVGERCWVGEYRRDKTVTHSVKRLHGNLGMAALKKILKESKTRCTVEA